MLDDEQHVAHPQGDCRHAKEAHRGDDILVVSQERDPAPRLARVDQPAGFSKTPGSRRDIEPVLQQLTVDARCARSILRHRADKALSLGIDSRSAWDVETLSLRYLRPVAQRTLAVPLLDRVRINDNEATRTAWSGGTQSDPESAVDIVQRGTRPLALECANLLRKAEILGQEFRAEDGDGPERTQSVIRKMSRRNIAEEFALPAAGRQAPPLGASTRLAINSKRLILSRDE